MPLNNIELLTNAFINYPKKDPDTPMAINVGFQQGEKNGKTINTVAGLTNFLSNTDDQQTAVSSVDLIEVSKQKHGKIQKLVQSLKNIRLEDRTPISGYHIISTIGQHKTFFEKLEEKLDSHIQSQLSNEAPQVPQNKKNHPEVFQQFLDRITGMAIEDIQEQDWEHFKRTIIEAFNLDPSINSKSTIYFLSTLKSFHPRWSHQMYDGAVNIRNEIKIPDISSLSISEENNSGASSSEKAIKRYDSTSEATTLVKPPTINCNKAPLSWILSKFDVIKLLIQKNWNTTDYISSKELNQLNQDRELIKNACDLYMEKTSNTPDSTKIAKLESHIVEVTAHYNKTNHKLDINDLLPALRLANDNNNFDDIIKSLIRITDIKKPIKQYHFRDGTVQTSILHIAAENGWNELLKLLLIEDGFETEKMDSAGKTALFLAAENGHIDTFKLLFQRNNTKVNINRVFTSKNTPSWCINQHTLLTIAAQKGHVAIVDLLLENSADINRLNHPNDALSAAAACTKETERSTIYNKLLTYGAKTNVDIHTIDNKEKHLKNQLALLNYHIDSKKTNNEELHLEKILIMDTVSFLTDKKANLPINLLILAGQCQFDQAFFALIKLIDITETTRFRTTIMHHAADKGWTDYIPELIKAGATMEEKNLYGKTPLHSAIEGGHTDIVELMINHKVKTNRIDRFDYHDDSLSEEEQTPLSLAVKHGHEKIVQLLLEHNPKMDAEPEVNPDNICFSATHLPIWYAIFESVYDEENFSSRKNIIKLLIKAGANIDISREYEYIRKVYRPGKFYDTTSKEYDIYSKREIPRELINKYFNKSDASELIELADSIATADNYTSMEDQD